MRASTGSARAGVGISISHPFTLSLLTRRARLCINGAAFASLCFIAACSPEAAEKSPAAEEEAKEQPTRSASGNELIECAIGGAQWFLRECEVEKGSAEDGSRILIVRHPDGGFRRFTVLTDGRGLEPADGAEQAQADLVDGRLDIRVADDRYRFPATVKAHASGE